MKYKMTISGTMPNNKCWQCRPMASEVKSWLEDLGFEFESLEVTESYADNFNDSQHGGEIHYRDGDPCYYYNSRYPLGLKKGTKE